jgi:hypothetical protein
MAEKEAGAALKEVGFSEEIAEDFNASSFGGYVYTGFPKPLRRYRLVYESQNATIEHTYFWVYNHLLQDQGYGDIIKTLDTFSASENSSFWGMTEQRKGLQQEKASNYLGLIGRMVKELFQIVREIRIIKERLRLYKEAAEGKQASDIALKGYWVDFVEGGNKSGSNIYVMARELGFGTLPDLFYATYVRDDGDVDKVVGEKAKEFNEKVKEVLRRKLALYMVWRKETEKELKVRERFTMRYLRQHWAVIRMYAAWVRPYLRNVQKLTAPDKYDHNPELISSFEGALMEIEFLAKRPAMDRGYSVKGPDGKEQTIYPVILATFNYRVSPQMVFSADGGNRGPAHFGRVEFSLRAYGWTQSDIDAYLKYRDKETLELIQMIDSSVKDAMEALGNDLMEYLKEAGETFPSDETKEDEPKRPKKEKRQPMNFFEPFTALFDGFKEMALLPFGGQLLPTKEERHGPRGSSSAAKDAAKDAAKTSFMVFKLYKKAHGMPAW